MTSAISVFGQLRSATLHYIMQRIRPLIVIAILGVCAVAPIVVPEQYILALAALPIVAFGAIYLLKYPALGLIGMIVTIIVPISGPSGSNATMALAGFLLVLWLLSMVVSKRISIIKSPTITPLLLFVLVTLLSFGFGQIPWYRNGQPAPMGAQLGSVALVVLSAAVYLVTAHWVRDDRWLKWLVFLFIIIGTPFILSWIIPGVSDFTYRIFVFGSTGSLLWMWLAALSFSQGVFNNKLRIHWRFVLVLLTLTIMYVGLIEIRDWNSGWMPAAISIVVILWVAVPRMGILFTVAGVGYILYQLQKIIGLIMIGDNSYSLSTRLEAWTIVLELTKVSPILGLGPANYRWYTPLIPIRGWAVQFNSHSQFVDLIAQSGILGFLAFIWFFIAVGLVGWRLRNRMPEGFPRAYVYGAVGGVAGTFTAAALGDWVVPFFYNVGLAGFRSSMLSWLFLGGLLALEQIYIPHGQAQDELGQDLSARQT